MASMPRIARRRASRQAVPFQRERPRPSIRAGGPPLPLTIPARFSIGQGIFCEPSRGCGQRRLRGLFEQAVLFRSEGELSTCSVQSRTGGSDHHPHCFGRLAAAMLLAGAALPVEAADTETASTPPLTPAAAVEPAGHRRHRAAAVPRHPARAKPRSRPGIESYGVGAVDGVYGEVQGELGDDEEATADPGQRPARQRHQRCRRASGRGAPQRPGAAEGVGTARGRHVDPAGRQPDAQTGTCDQATLTAAHKLSTEAVIGMPNAAKRSSLSVHGTTPAPTWRFVSGAKAPAGARPRHHPAHPSHPYAAGRHHRLPTIRSTKLIRR